MSSLTLKKIEDLLSKKNFKQLSMYCNRDITNLPKIVDFIKEPTTYKKNEVLKLALNMDIQISTDTMLFFVIQTWLLAILSNPFDWYKVLDDETKNVLYNYVYKNIIQQKLSLKICVLLLPLEFIVEKNIFDFYEVLKEESKNKKLDKGIISAIIQTLSKQTNLCKESINRVEKNNLHTFSKILTKLFLDENDPYILMCKFKILSHQYKYHPSIIKLDLFFQYLNYNNFKFGYVLCRSFLRVFRFFKCKTICENLLQNLDTIFANEMLWINSFHILGSLIFKHYEIDINPSIIQKAIFYNCDDVNYRSSLLREYTLFLIYAIIRNKSSDFLINILIYVCIFDKDFKIRRIAASILSELLNIDICVKRTEDLLKSYDSISKVYNIQIQKYIENNNNDINFLELRSHIIIKYGYLIQKKNTYETIFDYLDLGFKFKFTILYEKDINFLISFFNVDISTLFRYRFIENLIDLYLEVLFLVSKDNKLQNSSIMHEIIHKKQTIDNVIFILSKNIKNSLIFQLIWIIDSKIVYDYIFKNRKKTNHNIIIGNIRNNNNIDTIISEYKSIIKLNSNIDYITAIYKSLSFYQGDIQLFKNEILIGLENYYLNSHGDVCYKIRLECLLLCQFDKGLFNKYLVRYLVDKSKYIRDYLFDNLKKYKDIIIGYDILCKKDIYIIIENINLFDELNITIGVLGYISTCDNFDLVKILDLFIFKLEIFDRNIKKLIQQRYTRVFKYIFNLIDLLYEKNVKRFIKEWNELLKNYDIERYTFNNTTKFNFK